MNNVPWLVMVCAATSSITPAGGCASSKHTAVPHTVRQEFVPNPDTGGGKPSYGRASWTRLVPQNDGSGTFRLMAHAGVGERFPVKEVDGRCLYEVLVVGGDDNCLNLEIHSVERSRRIELTRDKPVKVKIGAQEYELLYPSVSVNADGKGKPTSNQALVLIHRRGTSQPK